MSPGKGLHTLGLPSLGTSSCPGDRVDREMDCVFQGTKPWTVCFESSLSPAMTNQTLQHYSACIRFSHYVGHYSPDGSVPCQQHCCLSCPSLPGPASNRLMEGPSLGRLSQPPESRAEKLDLLKGKHSSLRRLITDSRWVRATAPLSTENRVRGHEQKLQSVGLRLSNGNNWRR